jgi:uncharacterized integral membrane protein
MMSHDPGPSPVPHHGGALPPEPTPVPSPYSMASVTPADAPAVEPRPAPPAVPEPDPQAVQPTSPAPDGRRRTPPAPRSRVGGVWAAAVLFAAVLLLLLIFVLENGQRTEISFFGQHGHLPQGVALLLAAVCGILLVAIPGTARIIQLRIRDRRHRTEAAPPAGAPESTDDGTN